MQGEIDWTAINILLTRIERVTPELEVFFHRRIILVDKIIRGTIKEEREHAEQRKKDLDALKAKAKKI